MAKQHDLFHDYQHLQRNKDYVIPLLFVNKMMTLNVVFTEFLKFLKWFGTGNLIIGFCAH